MSGISATVEGTANVMRKLQALNGAAREMLNRALKEAVIQMQSDIVTSVQAHLSQGETYKRHGIEHVASALGFPWNSDTGTGASSVHWEVDEEALEAGVSSNLDYLLWLELGTKKMEERPTFGPAIAKARDEFTGRLKFSLDKVK